MSDRWNAWKESVFGSGYMIWHDGLDTSAVTSRTGAARAEALEMLRLGLSVGDPHAAAALAAMHDAESIAAMRAALADARETSRVSLALSIHAIAPDPLLASHLIHVLQSTELWSWRMDAAIGLGRFSGMDDERALLDAVEKDADYLVRYHAASSLLTRWSISPSEISEHRSIFERICSGPQGNQPSGPDDFVRHHEARGLLEALKPRPPHGT